MLHIIDAQPCMHAEALAGSNPDLLHEVSLSLEQLPELSALAQLHHQVHFLAGDTKDAGYSNQDVKNAKFEYSNQGAYGMVGDTEDAGYSKQDVKNAKFEFSNQDGRGHGRCRK